MANLGAFMRLIWPFACCVILLGASLSAAGDSFPAKAAVVVKNKDWKELESLSRDWIRAYPKEADAHASLGVALAQQHRAGEAIPALKEALGLNKEHPKALYALAILLSEQKHRNGVVACYDTLRFTSPQMALVLLKTPSVQETLLPPGTQIEDAKLLGYKPNQRLKRKVPFPNTHGRFEPATIEEVIDGDGRPVRITANGALPELVNFLLMVSLQSIYDPPRRDGKPVFVKRTQELKTETSSQTYLATDLPPNLRPW